MKKIIAITLILALCLSFVGCGKEQPQTPEEPKDYVLDKDILQDLLFQVTVEGDRDAFNGVYAVTDETYDKLVGDIVSKDLITDYIVFLAEDEFASSSILLAFQTEKVDEVKTAVNEYMATYTENHFLSSDSVGIYEESGWYVWSISYANGAVKEVVKRGMEKSVMQNELLALKESIPVFAMNMPSTLDDEYFALEGMVEKTDLEDMYILNSTIIGVNPLMIFKPVEGAEDTIKEFMNTWKENQLSTMEWYQPHLVPIINSMELVEENGYLIYIINEYPDVTKKAISDSWVEVK